ncbi:MAG: radical SAM protein [Myxococcales bacterium]|nr:radical SAM protein [Myxococcales bacterium]
MRVLLVGPDYEANLSLAYLASSLRAAGHRPAIAAFNTAEDAPSVLRMAGEAELVGLSMCFQVRAVQFLELAEALKRGRPQRPVIAGGHYASCAAFELLSRHPAIDLIVTHEGEQTLVELADLGEALLERAASVRGVVIRKEGKPFRSPPRPAIADLDRLPRPDRSGPARLLCGVPTAYLMGSRGCVSRCDYCCITTLHRLVPGPRFRQRTPEDVADEMAELYHRHGARQFVFHDDNFLVPSHEHNRERIARLHAFLIARGVSEIGLVLKCSPRDADRRILETLKELGLLRIFMGIESGSSCGLESIGRRQSVEQSERALEACEELGISTQYTMIILHPEASAATMLADLDFVTRHPGHPLNYCRAEIYAGTPLEARMLAAGRAKGNYLGRTYRYTDPTVERVWERGRDLFAGRCWGKDDLLGRVIRMDHQVAVLGRFYRGRKVRELVRSFLEWERELNLETAGFFRELVLACEDSRTGAASAFERTLEDLRRRELSSREGRIRQACDFRKALEGFSHASVEMGRRYALGLSRGRKFRGPRHAAAVAVAIGMLGCQVPESDARRAQDSSRPRTAEGRGPSRRRPDAGTIAPRPVPPRPDQGVAEAAPPPIDIRPEEGVAEAPPPPLDPRDDLGVAEAAPPPIDPTDIEPAVPPKPPPPPPPRADAGSRASGGKWQFGLTPGEQGQRERRRRSGGRDAGQQLPIPDPNDFRMDHGVAEAAPPPWEDGNRLRIDQGVAEAPPPPLELIHRSLLIRTKPQVSLSYAGREVTQPFALPTAGRVPLVIGEADGPISARLQPVGRTQTQLTFMVESSRPLAVQYGKLESPMPARIQVDLTADPADALVLQDPQTGARLEVRFHLQR